MFSYIFRSLSNLNSQKTRSMKSVRIPWYQKPILHNNKYFNIQRGSMLAALFSFVCTIQSNFSYHRDWFQPVFTHFHRITYLLFMICYSSCQFSQLLPLPLIYIACRWQLLVQLITDTTSYHMNSFMLAIDMVKRICLLVATFDSFIHTF